MKTIVFLALIALVIVAVVMILRPSGPRITRIEHRREEDDRKDDDDA